MSNSRAAGAVLEDDLREHESWIEEVYSLQPRSVTSTPIAGTILRRDDAGAVAMIRAYVVKLELLDRERGSHEFMHTLANRLLKTELPFTEDDLIWFADRAGKTQHFWEWPLAGMVTAIERHVARNGQSDQLDADVIRMRKNIEQRGMHKSERDLIARLNRVVGHSEASFAVDPGEPWAGQLPKDVAGMRPALRNAWTGLLAHAQRCTGSRPSPQWTVEASRHVDAVGQDEFFERTGAWFTLFGGLRTDEPPAELHAERAQDPAITKMWRCDISRPNGLLLKGLIWTCRARPDPRHEPVLQSLMKDCLHKTPFGKRFAEGATACRRALEELE